MAAVSTSGVWTSVSVALSPLEGLDTKSIRWGQPANAWRKPSGYSFEGVTSVPVPGDGSEFKLGTFSHSNFAIHPGYSHFTATLQVTLRFEPGGPSRVCNLTFQHTETPNAPGADGIDHVALAPLQPQETWVLNGSEYTLHLCGFRHGGSLDSQLRSPEGQFNSAELIARLVPAVKPIASPPREDAVPSRGAFKPGALFAPTLERLNRQSVMFLLEQISAKLHASGEPPAVAAAPDLHAELLALVAGLHQTTSHRELEQTAVEQQLSALHLHVEQMVHKVVQQLIDSFDSHAAADLVNKQVRDLDFAGALQQIEQLSLKLQLIQKSAQGLSTAEVAQVEELLRKLVKSRDLGPLVHSIQLDVDGRRFDLRQLVEVLATAEQVVNTQLHYAYSESDSDEITGAQFILTDATEVHFRVRKVERADGGQVVYRFETDDWKGLTAHFSLVFSRPRSPRTRTRCAHFSVCDAVAQSDIVFDLRPRPERLETAAEPS